MNNFRFALNNDQRWPVAIAAIVGGVFSFLYSCIDSQPWPERFVHLAIGAVLRGFVVLLCLSIFPGKLKAEQFDCLHQHMPQIAAVTFIIIGLITTLATWKQSPSRLMDIAISAMTGIVGAVITVVGIQVYVFSEKMGANTERMDQLETKLESANSKLDEAVSTLKRDLVATASATIGALENVLKTDRTYDTKLLGKQAPAVTAGLKAMGLTYSAWVDRFNTEKDLAAKVWLAAFPTFHREVAFDLNSGEIVTNSRNFCFLLLSAVSEMLEHSDGATLVYHHITPVHPKDWYNWPHGYTTHLYFENDFIGVYHRSLALLKTWATGKKLLHKRYILSVPDRTNCPFGWSLPEEHEFKESEKFHLLHFAVPLDKWPHIDGCEFSNALRRYYQASAREFSGGDLKGYYAVPAWNEKWADHRDGDSEELRTAREQLRDLRDCKIARCDCSAKLRDAAIAGASEEVRLCSATIDEVVHRLGGEELAKVWAALQKHVNVDGMKDFPEFIRDYQLASVYLSCDPDGTRAIRNLLAAVLRRNSASQPSSGWGNLYQTFAKELHPEASNARRAILKDEDLQEWKTLGVWPEFAILGLLNNDTQKPDWKVVVTTSLEYPFEVAQIRILSKPADRSPYEDIVARLDDTSSARSIKSIVL